MRIAAIGIGSNSLRMLVADITGSQLVRLKRYREGLRVFAALDENRCILPDMMAQACQSVGAFAAAARSEGAEAVHLFATSAVRDAGNADELAAALSEVTGLTLHVVSGEEEARLSFWGVVENHPCGLIDIGGGSTELAIGLGKQVDDAVSLQMGAVRLFRTCGIASRADALHVADMARQIIAPVKERFANKAGLAWTGVGGTFTTTAALAQRIPWQERGKIHGYSLTQEAVRECMLYLAPMPVEERLALPSLQPQRADIVVHGLAILLACMEELGIPRLTVSEYGNLEGYLKARYLF